MGRSPCCSKEGLNRGAWTALEDKILTAYIKAHGEGKWRNLPKRAGLKRCGKSCRLRWLNYLRPDIKRGNISHDEEELIVRLHKLLGNRWSLIAGRLPGRTDNEIKNYWNTTLGKKANGQSSSSSSVQSKEETPQSKTSEALNSPPQVVIRTKATRCSKVIVSVQHPPQKLNVSKSKPTEDEDATQKTPSPSNRDQNSGDSPRFGHGDLVGFGKFPPPEFLTGGGYGGYYDGRNLDLGDCNVGLSFEGPMLDDWTTNVCLDEDNATLDLESLAFLLDYEEWQ